MDWFKGNKQRSYTKKLINAIQKREKEESEIITIGRTTPEVQQKRAVENTLIENQKEVKKKREEQKEEEQKTEDQLFVINNAKIKMGSHMGTFKVLNNTPTIQGKTVGTKVEKSPANFSFLDGFQILSVTGDWQDIGTTKYQDNEALIKKSTLMVTGKMPPPNAPIETGKIEFIDSGQINIPENIDTRGMPVPENEKKNENICSYCDEEITLEQVEKIIGKMEEAQKKNVVDVLVYINKYRKNFGLDTCLRKAHFIAQIARESAKFKTFEEKENYSSSISLGIFSSDLIEIDDIIIESLKDHLSSIFKITDAENIELAKTNVELKEILLKERPFIIDGELYATYKGEEKLLKQVLKQNTKVDFNILLKKHSYFGIPLMSRAYASFVGDKRGLGNGDELSRDGWKFKGRGLKQITGRYNYKQFSEFRNKQDFPDDISGKIDFTEDDISGDIKKGNYIKISENPMYAVQSAIWFWFRGNKYNKKYAFELADEDDIKGVSKAVNPYENKKGLQAREDFYNKAREKDAFDITRHFKDIYDKGNDTQKEEAKKYFEKWKEIDEEAKKLFEEISQSDTKNEIKK
ncbi:hypothetical protein [Capnocytophaga canis]|uniref:hypothetical protein n=1 Tax=Capnocytophaga canis TaxID=1848903 RepID=UPI0037CFA544